MIYDRIENAPLYRGISHAMDTALDLIQNTDLEALSPGRHECADGVYCVAMNCDLKPAEEIRWEAHRKYIDIQIGFAKGELIGVLPTCELKTLGEYDPNGDIAFAEDDALGLPVPSDPGMFLVLFPTDAHRPNIAAKAPMTLHKIVVKVPV